MKTLPEYISEHISTQFEWGVNDCMTFTIGWVENVTGKKYLPAKLWVTEKQALARIAKEGGLIAVFDKHFTRINPNFAKDGDLTIIEGNAGIFSGRHVVSLSKSGIGTRLRNNVTVAWEFA